MENFRKKLRGSVEDMAGLGMVIDAREFGGGQKLKDLIAYIATLE